MNKEELEIELAELNIIRCKIETIINLNMSGKFIVSNEKIVGVRQILLNSIVRMQQILKRYDSKS